MPEDEEQLPDELGNLIKDKTCSRCGKTKPEFDFYQDKNRKDGLYPWCKDCYRTYRQHLQSFSPDEVLLESLILELRPQYDHPVASCFSGAQRRLADSLTFQGKPVWVVSYRHEKVWKWREWKTPRYTDLTKFYAEENK